jgi:hypothetical protein
MPAIEAAVMRGRLDYVGMLAIGMTLTGALSVQLKDMSKGREPRDMNTKEFYQAAALQGGGVGILGDFVFGNYARAGTDPVTSFIAGPVGGLAINTGKIFSESREGLLGSEDQTSFINKAGNQLLRSMPFNSLWYARLAYERTIIDGFNYLTDEDYDLKAQKAERRMEKNFGAGHAAFAQPYVLYE